MSEKRAKRHMAPRAAYLNSWRSRRCEGRTRVLIPIGFEHGCFWNAQPNEIRNNFLDLRAHVCLVEKKRAAVLQDAVNPGAELFANSIVEPQPRILRKPLHATPHHIRTESEKGVVGSVTMLIVIRTT